MRRGGVPGRLCAEYPRVEVHARGTHATAGDRFYKNANAQPKFIQCWASVAEVGPTLNQLLIICFVIHSSIYRTSDNEPIISWTEKQKCFDANNTDYHFVLAG